MQRLVAGNVAAVVNKLAGIFIIHGDQIMRQTIFAGNPSANPARVFAHQIGLRDPL